MKGTIKSTRVDDLAFLIYLDSKMVHIQNLTKSRRAPMPWFIGKYSGN